MLPVEKMAARITARHHLGPPYDLNALVARYANVEYRPFPFDADGLTIGIGRKTRPEILINDRQPGVRQKFTLAHELGHVIIPWHIGTIVSSHEFDDSLDSEYSRLEAEANLFAAELLMPSRWITEIFEVARPFTDSVSLALRTSGVSRDALLIKLFRVIEHPVLCVQHGDGGNILKRYATSSSPKGFSCDSVEGFDLRIERSQATREVFALGDRHYVSWVFRPLVIGDVDPRSWREVFEEILRETGTLPYKQSANASLAAKYQRLKGKPVEEICAAIFNSFKANDMLIGIASHPLFPQYVIKRVNELRSGKRSKRT